MNVKFANVDYWKAIILYGLNVATYKIALGKTLLGLAQNNKNEIDNRIIYGNPICMIDKIYPII